MLGGALEFDGEGDYVDIGDDPIFKITGQITVACWIKVSQFTDSWQAIFTMGDDSWRLQRQTTTDNLCWACTGVTGTPGDWWLYGDVNVNDGEWHHAAGVYDGSKYYLYVDGELDASKDASGTMSISSYPANGAVDIKQTSTLSWSPGVYGVSHEVYFGKDKDAVKNTDTSSPEYKGSGNLGSESYDPGLLEWETNYHWRIDEANNTNPDSPWTGPLWSFTTANFLVVDDFESYNDLDTTDPASNRIYLAWADGFDNPAINGSVVGYANPPFAEQTIVHGGNQSMPMSMTML